MCREEAQDRGGEEVARPQHSSEQSGGPSSTPRGQQGDPDSCRSPLVYTHAGRQCTACSCPGWGDTVWAHSGGQKLETQVWAEPGSSLLFQLHCGQWSSASLGVTDPCLRLDVASSVCAHITLFLQGCQSHCARQGPVLLHHELF